MENHGTKRDLENGLAGRFTISWYGGSYYVSIPNYQGGEVVRAEIADALAKALSELHALVWGECPSLLNENSGGSARLDLEIAAALAAARGEA